jgi:hypothetical protein
LDISLHLGIRSYAVFVFEIRGVVNPSAANYVRRALRDAEERRTRLVLIEMDTPGGLEHSMREMVYMKKYRPVLAAAMALLFYTFADILIWQRIFETNQMVQYANIYHTGWFVSLAGYAILGIVFMWGAWKDCLYYLVALFVGAFSGLEDMLYYILDGKSMPESLPWLEGNLMIFHVSREGVIWSVSLWLVALVLLYLLLYQWQMKARKSFSNESDSVLGTLQDVSNKYDESLKH